MIKIVETNDYETLATLNEEVQNLHAQMYPKVFKPYNKLLMTAAMKQFLAESDCRAYLAYYNNELAGSLLCYLRELKENAFHYHLKSVYIDQISVLKNYRNSGIGQALLKQAEWLAGENGISKLELDHWSKNTVAAGFFRKYGYVLNKERLFKFIE